VTGGLETSGRAFIDENGPGSTFSQPMPRTEKEKIHLPDKLQRDGR
jgi:hypothetical protein